MQRRRVRYRARPEIDGETPVHVTIRVADGTWNLRKKRTFRIVRQALVAASRTYRFRLIQYVVLGNHLHLIGEADDTYALSRAMRSLSIRIARNLNALMGTRGRRIAQRYHAAVIRSPQVARLVMRYVLNNQRRHAAQWGEHLPRDWVDPCSSGLWFDGWSRAPARARDPCPDLERGTTPAQSFLLADAWRAYGLIDPSEIPGPMGA